MMRGRPLGPATLIDPSGAGKARNWIRKTLSRIFAQLAKHSQHAVVVEIFGLYCWWDVKGEIASQGVDDGLLRKADTAKESSTSPWHKNSFHRLIDRRGEIVDKMISDGDLCILPVTYASTQDAVDKLTPRLDRVASGEAIAPNGDAPVFVIFRNVRPWTACPTCDYRYASLTPLADSAFAGADEQRQEAASHLCQRTVYRWEGGVAE